MDAGHHALRFFLSGLWQHKGKFIATVTRRRIDRAAMEAKNIRQAAKRPASYEMPMRVVDFLQPIQIQQKHSEGPTGPQSALCLCIEHIQELAVICQAGKRIAGRQVTNLFEYVGAIQQSPTDEYEVTDDVQFLGEYERTVQKLDGFAGGQLRSMFNPRRGKSSGRKPNRSRNRRRL